MVTASWGWLVLAAAAAAAADQYEQQATRRSGHRFNVQHELQVGCADGAVHHDHQHHGPVLQVLKRLKRQAEQRRQRRDYIQWYGSTSTYQQPNFVQSYQIPSPVPYYVPIWGNPRRIPIFFPAKPILLNPGYPFRNPPGNKITTEKPPATVDGTPITIGNRINVNEAGEPIWGIIEPDSPENSLSGGGASSPPVASRPPQNRPTRPPTPPLLHRPSLGEDTNQAPRPSGLSDRDNPNLGQASSSGFAQQFPPIQFRPSTTTTPPPPPSAVAPREEPNRCVWAIISCCNPTNTQVSINCFERLGCPGSFWDRNPCSREVTAAAFNAAAKFYEQT